MPSFHDDVKQREAAKATALAPFIEAALARKQYMQPLSAEDTPVVKASVKTSTTDAQKK